MNRTPSQSRKHGADVNSDNESGRHKRKKPSQNGRIEDWMQRMIVESTSRFHARPKAISRRRGASSDSLNSEEKTAPYRDQRYAWMLESYGSFLRKSPAGVADKAKQLCKDLCKVIEALPKDTPFRDETFESFCESLSGRNEAKIFRELSHLIVPPAERLALQGDEKSESLKGLVEGVDEVWSSAQTLAGPPPKPDYCVGFKRSAFTDQQLQKLRPWIGNTFNGDTSLVMATSTMLFPFLACEVKCGREALDVADNQNAHSMTIALRGVAQLFQAVGRGSEVDRQILGFSFSHDNQSVRIYGHYVEIKETDIKYYRHDIRKYDITDCDGRDKFTAYGITMRIYQEWMPNHLKRLCSAIDDLPVDSGSQPLLTAELTQESEDALSQAKDNLDTVEETCSDRSATSSIPDMEEGARKHRKVKA